MTRTAWAAAESALPANRTHGNGAKEVVSPTYACTGKNGMSILVHSTFTVHSERLITQTTIDCVSTSITNNAHCDKVVSVIGCLGGDLISHSLIK